MGLEPMTEVYLRSVLDPQREAAVAAWADRVIEIAKGEDRTQANAVSTGVSGSAPGRERWCQNIAQLAARLTR